jgi:hypothetical protein
MADAATRRRRRDVSYNPITSKPLELLTEDDVLLATNTLVNIAAEQTTA